MFRKGHRLFSAASIGLIVVALMHLLSHLAPMSDDLVLAALLVAMEGYRFDVGLGMPSMLGIFESLGLAMAIMLLWVGLNNLLVARYAELRGKLMRRVCTLCLCGIGALVAAFLYHDVAPPAITLGIVWILFFVARYRLRSWKVIHAPLSAHPEEAEMLQDAGVFHASAPNAGDYPPPR